MYPPSHNVFTLSTCNAAPPVPTPVRTPHPLPSYPTRIWLADPRKEPTARVGRQPQPATAHWDEGVLVRSSGQGLAGSGTSSPKVYRAMTMAGASPSAAAAMSVSVWHSAC